MKKVTKKETPVKETEVVKSIDLRDTMEYFAAFSLIADQYGLIMEDGKVDFNDAKHFVKFVTEYKVFVNAIEDSGNVIAELKDLDEAELLQIGIAAFAIIKKISASKKKAAKNIKK